MKGAKRLNGMVQSAKKGGWSLTKLNWALWIGIPFNKPHRIKVQEIGEDYIKTYIPYRRKNFNHIKGIHACGLATTAEFSTGLLLTTRIDPSHYRVIMSELRMEYHYQAKMACIAKASLTEEQIQKEIVEPLKGTDKIMRTMISEIHDVKGNHVATGHITWQIKAWSKVKTKVS